jgi:hypothetical protein
MTEPVSTTSQIAGGSTLIGLFTAIFGAKYGTDVAIITSGVFGAFFALASSDKLLILPPVPDDPKVVHGFWKNAARILHVHTPYHRAAWISLLRGGMFAGLTTHLVVKNIAAYLPKEVQVTVPDLLLITALLIGALADRIIPLLRSFVNRRADSIGKSDAPK